MMKCKTDEDLPRALVERLRQSRYDATSVQEQKLCGSKDADLWEIVQKENRFFITADKGFGDIRFYPPGSHKGILVLRPDEEGIAPLSALLEAVLTSYSLKDLEGSICVVTPRGIRIRKPG